MITVLNRPHALYWDLPRGGSLDGDGIRATKRLFLPSYSGVHIVPRGIVYRTHRLCWHERARSGASSKLTRDVKPIHRAPGGFRWIKRNA